MSTITENHENETEMQLLWTARRAARALNMSERTLSTHTANGTIPSIKVGHLRRYSPVVLQQWIEDSSRESA
ncbi:helix-turn-helix domain-containing protein [Planctomycetota bacterium]